MIRDVVAGVQKVFVFILVRLYQAVSVTDDDQAIADLKKCDANREVRAFEC